MTPRRPVIIAFAPHSWEDRWLSRQQLLSRLGRRGWPVIYSHGPLSLWDRGKPLWDNAPWIGNLAETDGIRVDRPGRLPPAWPSHPLWDRLAHRLHGERLRRATGDGKILLFLFHPAFWPYTEILRPAHVVYHVYDVHSAMVNWNPRWSAWEAALVERADLITTSSEGMARTLPGAGPIKARVLHNGADSRRFLAARDSPCPEDLAAIPHPRIGYIGTVNAKIDLGMILTLSTRRPEWHWVFIGPVMLTGERERELGVLALWEKLRQRKNIHLLGSRPREAVPAYVQHMDVNTICYRIADTAAGEADDWVVHGYPVKLHESLATGRPLVAAAQESVKNHFSHVARIATTTGEWENALVEALERGGVGTPELRRAVALQNTWDERVDRLENWLLELGRDTNRAAAEPTNSSVHGQPTNSDKTV
ncbi:MAG: hypothetical protein HQL59_02795 [Magnetococcales bacterium]|nr:hypothetical protein [Magnetococcales bacterium]